MHPFKPTLLAALVAALAIDGAHAQSLPVLSSVVNGSAAVNTVGNQMTVTNSAGAIIEWSKFSIAAGFGTHFNQPNAASSVLNRVVGSDPSNIFGSLTSNGKVFLINPIGIVFGQGSKINVGALVASTVPLSNANFQAGSLNFGALPTAGHIQVDGTIAATDSVLLTATNIALNGGSVTVPSPSGSITITSVNSGNISMSGAATVSGGNVNMSTGGTINISGSGPFSPGNPNLAGNLGMIGNLTANASLLKEAGGIAVSGISNNIAGQISLAGSNAISLATTTSPGVRFVVPLAPNGSLGSVINAQGQIGLLGNRTIFGGSPIATTAVVGADGTVRLTAKKSD